MGLGELLRDSPEQFAVFQAAGKHQSIVVEALAGTGKTTTLVACGEKLTLENKKVLYLAFNREIVKETKGKAKALFDCYTAHSTGFYIKKTSQNKLGFYNLDFKCSADYDLFYRMIVKEKLKGIATKSIPKYCPYTKLVKLCVNRTS